MVELFGGILRSTSAAARLQRLESGIKGDTMSLMKWFVFLLHPVWLNTPNNCVWKKQRLPQTRPRRFKCVNVSVCVDKRLSWILTLKRRHAPLAWAPWKIMAAHSRWDPLIKGGTRTVLFVLHQYYDVHWCVQFTSWVKFSWNKLVIQKAGWNLCVSERSSWGISEVFTNKKKKNNKKFDLFAPLVAKSSLETFFSLWRRVSPRCTSAFDWIKSTK